MTGGLTDDEQGGFRAGKWCVDQAFTLKQVVEKAQEKKRSVYVGFIDWRRRMIGLIGKLLWQVLSMYDVEGKLLSGVKSIYADSKCVRLKEVRVTCLGYIVWGDKSVPILLGFQFFSVYMDAVTKEVNMRVGRRGESRDYLASCMQMTWLYVVS